MGRSHWIAAAVAAWFSLASPVLGQAGTDDGFDLEEDEAAEQVSDAAPEPAPTRSPMEVAREHMERGQALYEAGRYIESAEEFLSAYEAQPFSAFLYNAGVAYEKVDDPGRAADYFGRFLQTDPQAGNAAALSARIERLRGLALAREQAESAATAAAGATGQDAARVQAELATARQRLAEVEAQLAALGGKENFKSLLSVQITPPDATVTVKDASGDTVYSGRGSLDAMTLDAGTYLIEVEHPKYKTLSHRLNVAPGRVHVLVAEMSQGQFLGFLRVESDVPGANVFVDERDAGALGRTPFQNAVKTGKHHLWIERPGYKVVERDVDVQVGEDTTVKVDLERVDHGRVRVVANRPDAEVYIDGKRIGRVPIETEVPHGAHEVRVSAEGMKDWEETVDVQRGQATPLRVRLRPRMGRAGAWVTAGIAAGVLGGSIAVGMMGKKLDDGLANDRSAGMLRSDDDRPVRGKWYYIGADVGFGLTLGLAALSTYYFLRDPLPDSEGRVLEPRDWAFNPVLAPGRAGGNMRMRF